MISRKECEVPSIDPANVRRYEARRKEAQELAQALRKKLSREDRKRLIAMIGVNNPLSAALEGRNT